MSVRYDAGVKVLDLKGDPLGATRTINAWVAAKTRDKILDLIPEGAISPSTPLVLTNALYFYGSWKAKFSPSSTREGTFYAPRGEVTAQMMNDLRSLRYGEGDGYQIIDLPYAGDHVAMTIVLPAAGRFSEIRSSLSESHFASMRSSMEPTGVRLTLPKFRFTWGTSSLRDSLMAMGMVDAFDGGRADFSGIFGTRSLYIDDVLHQALIGIDESGTEAAAATAVVTRGTSVVADPREFKADRPFLVFIRDDAGALLFAGQVVDPTS
jgi:serpin B